MIHELKIWPQYYEHVASGNKNFEFRENDRGFQPGDGVDLREWNPATKGYTRSPTLRFKIGYVLPVDSRVVFSLLPWDEK